MFHLKYFLTNFRTEAVIAADNQREVAPGDDSGTWLVCSSFCYLLCRFLSEFAFLLELLNRVVFLGKRRST